MSMSRRTVRRQHPNLIRHEALITLGGVRMDHKMYMNALVLSTLAFVAAANADVAPVSPVASYGQLPLAFELNVGQVDAEARFLSRGETTVFLTERGDAVVA